MKVSKRMRGAATRERGVAGASEPLEQSVWWPVLEELDVPVVVKIPLRKLKLRELRTLEPGTVLSSDWPAAEEVPLHAAGVALSWCEFAVVGEHMAARLTRLG